MAENQSRIPEIDSLKGFCILSVVCIHAKLYSASFFHLYVINRAVPIFLVLFGVTSQLWWRSAENLGQGLRLGRFYLARSTRILLPVWVLSTIWWLSLLHLGPRAPRFAQWEVLAAYAGYAPWIGTSWFVFVIIQLVIVFPLLAWSLDLVGAALLVLGTAAICDLCMWDIWQIIALGKRILGDVPEPGFYYFWIFWPRVLYHVAVGMLVAEWWKGRPSITVTALSLALTVVGFFLARAVMDRSPLGPIREQMVNYLADGPLAVGMLGLFRFLPERLFVTRFLRWCGLYSWGIYIGHLLVHEVFYLIGFAPERATEEARAVYALTLFLLGALLAFVASLVVRGVRRATLYVFARQN
jgi:peptidoglycan/LPS O-acetylase OafA/YrhL